MRRFFPAVLVTFLALSVAVNGLLGWLLWRAQAEYRALARQFVRVKQEASRPSGESAASSATVPAPQVAETPAAPAATARDQAALAASASQAPATAPAPQVAAPQEPAPQVAAPSAKGSAQAVRQSYEPRFRAVQNDCEGRLNGLMEQAKAEYQQAKAGGRTIDVGALGAKYFTRAESLQRDCDRRVQALLAEMGAELRGAGLSTDLVDEVREAYENRIVERRAEIMSKAGQ